jgi:hypothetical protein
MYTAPPLPVLEVYYSPTCAPCRLELPAIVEFAREDGRRVRIVILDQILRAREEIRAVSPQFAVTAIATTERNPRTALHEAGDADGILPYARSIAPNGTICAQWRGILTLARARDLVAACTKTITSPAQR